MIAITQPFETKRDEATGELRVLVRPQGSFDQWERCLKLFIELAGTLARYQSPRLATIEIDAKPTEHHKHRHLHVRGTEGLKTVLRERGIPVDQLLTTVTLKPIKRGDDENDDQD